MNEKTISRYYPFKGEKDNLGSYRSGLASRMILVRSGRQKGLHRIQTMQARAQVFRHKGQDCLYTFSYLFVLNVFNVGNPADAQLYSGSPLPPVSAILN
jgi:hypothetical protein